VSTPTALLFAVLLLTANGFFVAAEFALLASRRSRLEQMAAEGSRGARQALAGKRELSLMLAGAQLGITICSLLLGAVAEPAVAHLFEDALGWAIDIPEPALHTIGFAIALSLVVFLHMVVGEMAPKSWAISHPERSAALLARPFRAFALALRPVIRLLNAMANGVIRLFGVEPQDELAMAHTPTDLLLLLDESATQGAIDPVEHQLFARTLELSGLDAGAAMIPRRHIVSVAADASAAALADAARSSGRSRIVVHNGDLDHVVGVAHVKDVLAMHPGRRNITTAGSLARAALVVHEGKSLENLLVDMRAKRQHLAIVVDEHGVVTGLITLEDVLEELIGDFEDESDRHDRHCRPDGENRWLVSGEIRPDELRDRVGIELPDGDWDTVAGYVIDELDRIPQTGDAIERPGYRFEVIEVDGFAVSELRLTLTASPAEPSRVEEGTGGGTEAAQLS